MSDLEHPVRPAGTGRRTSGGDLRRGAVGTLAGTVGAVATFAAARATGEGFSIMGRADVTEVPAGAVPVATITGGIAAVVLAALARRSRRPRRTFLIATAAGLLLSAVPPIQAAEDTSTCVWLLALHAVAALGIVPPVAAGLPTRR